MGPRPESERGVADLVWEGRTYENPDNEVTSYGGKAQEGEHSPELPRSAARHQKLQKPGHLIWEDR